MEQYTQNKELTPADIFLKNLRELTTPQHKALEDNEISKSLMDPAVTLEQYSWYLTCMSEVIRFFDDRIIPAITSVVADADSRKKYAEIKKDIEFLHSKGTQNRTSATFEGYTETASLPYIMGYAYVIEGSTLGGRVILKHLEKTLQLGEEGTSFFAGYGAETGNYWKNFIQAFCMYALRNQCEEEVIKGAQDGFSHIHAHFAKHSS